MYEQEFEQLLGMGAAGSRARAALLKTKGDLMEAAELVFNGEYDDLPSDDEEDASRRHGARSTPKQTTGLATPAETPEPEIEASMEEGDVVDVDDDDDGDMFDDEADYGGDDGFDLDMNESNADPGSGADPYAGIFFSKDRVETITEVQDYPIETSMPFPPGSSRTNTAGGTVSVVSLTRGEWMSGCSEGNEQSHLFQLYDILAEGSYNCPYNCGGRIHRKQSDFFIIFPDFDTYIVHLKSIVQTPCFTCQHTSCLACGERVEDANSKKKVDQQTENAKLYHCSNLQGVILGVALNMIEKLFEEQSNKRRKSSDSTPAPKKRKSSDDYNYAGHTGGKTAAKGTGYSGNAAEDTSGQKAAEKAQKERDTKLVETLREVKSYLPCLNRESGAMTSDYMVHPTSLAHLRRRSNFVNSLLRNDSLLDMSKRADLYDELFGWLEVVSNHEALASMLAMPQMRATGLRPTRLEPIPPSAAGSFSPVTNTITYEGAPSPRELLENIVIQAQAAIKGLEGTAPLAEEQDEEKEEDRLRMNVAELAAAAKATVVTELEEENAKLRDFCQRILATAHAIDRSLRETKGDAFVDRLIASLPKVPRSGSATIVRVEAGETDEETIKAYINWATQARFQYCDMSYEGQFDKWRHAYNAELLATATASAPRRSLAIAKELAMLTTNLPVAWHSTVFLRVDESRVDCIKALIIGPEGTPYENGCFLFDIFLPLEYNRSPPVVKIMTTNGGMYRFNPNLYAEGKVCLSLLGTWSGPGWIAGQSTLLQVLISIQSLIMTDEPYLNEPGWASSAGTEASKVYSANIARMTVKEAMINSIKKPPFPFEDEVHTHFRLKAKYIRKQMERWIKDDDGKAITADGMAYSSAGAGAGAGGSVKVTAGKTPMEQNVEELEGLLAKLEAGEDPSK